VPFPQPCAGLVIRYSYLWKREQEAGREEGTKDRWLLHENAESGNASAADGVSMDVD